MSDAGRDAVLGLVRAIVPTFEPSHRFVCDADGDRASRPLEHYAAQMRRFELRAVGGVEEGEIATASPCHWQERWEIVVSYPVAMGADVERLKRIVNSDTRQIIAAVRPPSGWSTYLSNLWFSGPVDLGEVDGEEGRVIAYHAAHPITVEYYATP